MIPLITATLLASLHTADTLRARPEVPDSGGPRPTTTITRIDTAASEVPFAWADFTWMNGQSRQRSTPLQFGTSLTGSLYLDTYYALSSNRPRDNTLTGSATIGRSGEFQINLTSVGVSWNHQNVIGRIELQTGNMLDIVQDLDGSVHRGRNLSTANLRNIRQASVGYHVDKAHGLDIEAGIFSSYIGLESYLLAENWNYNHALVSDFTPFYLQGVRASFYPTAKLKLEPWIMNGFQTFGRWNAMPSVGFSTHYRPTGSLGLIANLYYGADQRGNPARKRFHHDHSVLVRYLDRPTSHGVSKMAFSLNNHYGFERGGDGPSSADAYMAGTSFTNRIWFDRDRLAIAVRGEVITNPSRYLALAPTPVGFVDDGTSLNVRGLTATIDLMPTDFFTVRGEVMTRASDIPFFAGPGGTTSADGYQGTAGDFVPDVRRAQTLFTLAINFRL